jgi:hypothetical protein
MNDQLSWSHDVTDIPTRGLERAHVATAGELEAVAAALDFLACELLTVSYSLRPVQRGRFVLKGELVARVLQSCVVSLEPVADAITERFEIVLWPAEDLPEPAAGRFDPLAEDEPEPIIDGRICVGRIAFEILAAAINPYPRKEGAALERSESGVTRGQIDNPFAALAKIKGLGGL